MKGVLLRAPPDVPTFTEKEHTQMPKKETKKDKQAALKQTHTAPFSAPESPPDEILDNDPPIIVSGGSVKITSKVFLSVSYDERAKRYIYYTDAVKVAKIKTKGKHEQEDETDGGLFNIELREE